MNGEDWAIVQTAIDATIQHVELTARGTHHVDLPKFQEATRTATTPAGALATALMAVLLLEQAKQVMTRPNPKFQKLADDIAQGLQGLAQR